MYNASYTRVNNQIRNNVIMTRKVKLEFMIYKYIIANLSCHIMSRFEELYPNINPPIFF